VTAEIAKVVVYLFGTVIVVSVAIVNPVGRLILIFELIAISFEVVNTTTRLVLLPAVKEAGVTLASCNVATIPCIKRINTKKTTPKYFISFGAIISPFFFPRGVQLPIKYRYFV
jgi:hypothetical protein